MRILTNHHHQPSPTLPNHQTIKYPLNNAFSTELLGTFLEFYMSGSVGAWWLQDMENYSLMKLIRLCFIKYQFLNMQIFVIHNLSNNNLVLFAFPSWNCNLWWPNNKHLFSSPMFPSLISKEFVLRHPLRQAPV